MGSKLLNGSTQLSLSVTKLPLILIVLSGIVTSGTTVGTTALVTAGDTVCVTVTVATPVKYTHRVVM